MRPSITFYNPGFLDRNNRKGLYKSLSITGSKCELGCDHCKGRLLESMIHTPTPEKLIQKARRLAKKGHKGILISGGSDHEGFLPWNKFTSAIELIKQSTSLHVSIHSGFLERQTAIRLKESGVDAVLIDIVGTQEIYSSVFHLANGYNRLLETLKLYSQVSLNFVPHITLGLQNNVIASEYNSLDLLKNYDFKQLVIVVFMPIWETPKYTKAEISIDAIDKFMELTRSQFSSIELTLGCARPSHRFDIELSAINNGFDGIVRPSESTYQFALNQGMIIYDQPTCCCFCEKH